MRAMDIETADNWERDEAGAGAGAMLIQDDGQGRDESEGRRSTGEQRRRSAAVSADGRARLLVSMLVEWVAGDRARSR